MHWSRSWRRERPSWTARREAFTETEVKVRGLLKSLYDSGLESPLAGAEDGPAKLLPFMVRALEDVTLGLGPTAEAEARSCLLRS